MNDNQLSEKLTQIAKLIRYYCLIDTTRAVSAHPSSALSTGDLMTGFFSAVSCAMTSITPGIRTMTASFFPKAMPRLFSILCEPRLGN